MIIISQEVVSQVYPFSTVLYEITLLPIEEELWALDLALLVLIYAYDATFDDPVKWIALLLNLLLEEGAHWLYLLYLLRLLFICYSPTQEGAEQRKFEEKRLTVNFLSTSCYRGALVGQ